MKTFEMVLAAAAGLNLLTFLMMGIDKKRARQGRWRISERTLLALAAVGGALGAFVGMHFFRHKTKKPAFFMGLPVLGILQIVLALYLLS